MSLNPGYVATKMTKLTKSDMVTTYPDNTAARAFRDVGCDWFSNGAFRHSAHVAMLSMMFLMPGPSVKNGMLKGCNDELKKQRDAEKAKAN